jgi:hypothetical protein
MGGCISCCGCAEISSGQQRCPGGGFLTRHGRISRPAGAYGAFWTQDICSMATPGTTLNTLGRTYEVRGNGAVGSEWREKPLFGWITHLSAGWVFTPAPGTQYLSDGQFHSDFICAFLGRVGLQVHGLPRSTTARRHPFLPASMGNRLNPSEVYAVRPSWCIGGQ